MSARTAQWFCFGFSLLSWYDYGIGAPQVAIWSAAAYVIYAVRKVGE